MEKQIYRILLLNNKKEQTNAKGNNIDESQNNLNKNQNEYILHDSIYQMSRNCRLK